MPSSVNDNNGNYIKLFRKFKKWGWYSDPNTKAVFIHLLLSANWQDGEFRGEKIRAGECVFGRKKAAKDLGLSEQNVRTAINHLLKSGEISTTKVTNRFTIIKIEKWAFYQGRETESNHQSNQQLTSSQPAANHIQEEKEEKEGKEVCIARAREEAPAADNDFEIRAILTYLNEETGRSFRPTDQKTRALITARLEEGHRVSDFLTVIDNKTRQWLGDEKMEQFLTPRTLFSADHFEDYLAQTPTKKEAGPKEKSPAERILGRIRRGDSPARLSKTEADLVGVELYNELCRKQEGMTDDELLQRISERR